MTSVLLVDDHAVVRAGLAALLSGAEHLEVVGQAADGAQGVELAARLRPDVVLMDLSMPVLDGVAATKRIVADVPGTSVVVLTSFADRRHVTEAMRAGAVGYLVKDCDPREIIGAVRSAAKGTAPIDQRVAGVAAAALRATPASAPSVSALTPALTPALAPALASAGGSVGGRRTGLWSRVAGLLS